MKNSKNGHQGFQEYSLRVPFMFFNVEGLLAKIVKMANEYCGNIPQIFSAIRYVRNIHVSPPRGEFPQLGVTLLYSLYM